MALRAPPRQERRGSANWGGCEVVRWSKGVRVPVRGTPACVCMHTSRSLVACLGRGVIACATGWRVILSASGWVDLASRRVERQLWLASETSVVARCDRNTWKKVQACPGIPWGHGASARHFRRSALGARPPSRGGSRTSPACGAPTPVEGGRPSSRAVSARGAVCEGVARYSVL